MYLRILASVAVLVLGMQYSAARTCISVTTGAWNSSTTWLCDDVPSVPAGGDVVLILPGHTVTFTHGGNLTISGSPLYFYIYGHLFFSGGAKINLPCGSGMQVYAPDGEIDGTGGGSSNRINICGSQEWKVGDGPVEGGDPPLGDQPPPSPLPVHLLAFTGIAESHGILLEWLTASEINNDYFTLERSTDGLNFESLTEVPGHGNSNTTMQYSTNDLHPRDGINYYRLWQTDYDGKRHFQGIIAVEFNQTDLALLIYPNPVSLQGNFTISWAGLKEGGEIFIMDLNGRILYNTSCNQSTCTISGAHNGLTPGRYTVLCRNRHTQAAAPLIVN